MSETRLLWRGALIVENGLKLHGVAFVAQKAASLSPALIRPSLLRTLSSSSTKANAAAKLPVVAADDPFSAPAPKDRDVCLDLEMMRHKDISIDRVIDLKPAHAVHPAKIGQRSGLKQRIKSLKAGVLDAIDIEQGSDIDIRVYLDPRCSKTKDWFQNQFCDQNLQEQKRSNKGLLFSSGDSLTDSCPLVIYGTVTNEPPHILQLRIARKKTAIKQRAPRPDDPAPREALFAQSLKRSTSHTTLPFLSATMTTKSKPILTNLQSTKDSLPTTDQPLSNARNPFSKSSDRKRKIPETPGKGRSSKKLKVANEQALEEDATVRLDLNEGDVTLVDNTSKDVFNANKALIKKLVSQQLKNWDLNKQDKDYKELFSTTVRGVQFAVRSIIHYQALTEVTVLVLTQQHLCIYLNKPP